MTHPYSELPSFERLLLLVAAIAQNPGIAPQKGRNNGSDPMVALLDAMRQVAEDQGIELQRWSEHTIRKDLATLRKYGILPNDTALRSGYYLGRKQNRRLPPLPPTPRKSKLTIAQIKELRDDGLTLQQIGDRAGLSKERIRQLLR
jgi:hypothetical protein